MFRTTFVVGPNRRLSNIIGMEVFDLEIICCFGAFQQFMLDLLHDNILTIEHNENIAGSQVTRTRPSFDRRIEGVLRGTSKRLPVDRHMNPFFRLIAECLHNRFQRSFPRIRVSYPCKERSIYAQSPFRGYRRYSASSF